MKKSKLSHRQRNRLADNSSPRPLSAPAFSPEPIKIKIQIGRNKQTLVLVLTDAPPGCDGRGTFTMLEYNRPIEGMTVKDARLAAVLEEHINWQCARYQSGLHAASIDLGELGIKAPEIEPTFWSRLLRFGKVENTLKESVQALKEARRRIEASDEFETYDLSHQIDKAQNVLNHA